MSQKVRIERVSIRGATPYLGESFARDSDGSIISSEPIFSRAPNKIMQWLCNGWRTRFNQIRSRRSKYDADGNLVPIGYSVDNRKHSEARAELSYLESMPSLVMESTDKIERTEWFAALQRRKTLTSKNQFTGSMPRFRKKRQDDIFTCWFNGGRNATFEQVNRNHGIVSIKGQNGAHKLDGEKSKFVIRIHVTTSEPIREYTGVQVNWTKRTMVFTNPPRALNRPSSGAAVGIDRGVIHQSADSAGQTFDLPCERLRGIDREIRRRQRSMARSVSQSGHADQREYRRRGVSSRFADNDRQIRALKAHAQRIVVDFQQKLSTEYVRLFDVIVLEDLNAKNMLRSPAPVLGDNGKYQPNGRSAKRGLNRVLSESAMSRFLSMIEYKADRAGVVVQKVNPRNTSRRCHECGHIARENRKSQAVFRCVECGHTDNADINAALNILESGLTMLENKDFPVERLITRAGLCPRVEPHKLQNVDSVGIPDSGAEARTSR